MKKQEPLSTFPARNSSDFRRATAAFGQAVRELRLKRGLTIEGLARKSHVSASHLRRIETGSVNPLLHTLIQLDRSLSDSLELWARIEELCPIASLKLSQRV